MGNADSSPSFPERTKRFGGRNFHQNGEHDVFLQREWLVGRIGHSDLLVGVPCFAWRYKHFDNGDSEVAAARGGF